MVNGKRGRGVVFMSVRHVVRSTMIEVGCSSLFEFQRINALLSAAMGRVKSLSASEPKVMRFEWNRIEMVKHLERPSVAELLAGELAMLPEASEQYLGLLDCMIEDWQAVANCDDKTCQDRAKTLVQLLVTSRDQILKNLNEQPSLTRAVCDFKKGIALDEPLSVEGFIASLDAPQAVQKVL